ncbi:hypothetical protein AVEN_109864-1, partial [Araneus ventricosus]
PIINYPRMCSQNARSSQMQSVSLETGVVTQVISKRSLPHLSDDFDEEAGEFKENISQNAEKVPFTPTIK